VAFNRFFSSNISQTANQNSFTNTFGDTSIGLPGVADLSALSNETVQIVTWVRYKLGEPVLYVELDNKQIFASFEEANIKYSSLLNTYQIRNWMTNMYGLGKDFTLNDLTNKLPYNTYNFLKRQTQNIGSEVAQYVGGTSDVRKAYVMTNSQKQDYSILDDFIDQQSSSSIRQYLNSVSGSSNTLDVDIKAIFHYSPITLYRFYDPFSSINLLSQEFNFESFNTETIFYVLPIWNDILRAQQLNLNDKVRRSNVSYNRVGDVIRLYPRPQASLHMWIEFTSRQNPFGPSGSLSADPSITGISNMSNVPFQDISYDQLNPLSRNWIRQQTFALCLEELGRIRRKFRNIPIPNGDLQLDGDELVREGLERQNQLDQQLRNDLEQLSNVALADQELRQLQALNGQLAFFPNKLYLF